MVVAGEREKGDDIEELRPLLRARRLMQQRLHLHDCSIGAPQCECGKYMLEPSKVKTEAEECDTYEETGEEPVAMIEESPPDIGQDVTDNSYDSIKDVNIVLQLSNELMLLLCTILFLNNMWHFAACFAYRTSSSPRGGRSGEVVEAPPKLSFSKVPSLLTSLYVIRFGQRTVTEFLMAEVGIYARV
uniref:Uncharacterized protein n=1 Tax=Aegilops tauschii TaxID=37682 RepID=N1R032_AEGTA